MKIFVSIVTLFLLITFSVFAQLIPNQSQEESTAGAGVFFSPMMQSLNVSLDDINFLRRQNKPLQFTISMTNNLGVSLDFVSYASHVKQENGDFEAAPVLPDTEMYLTTQEDANNPIQALKRLSQENYSNEIFFPVIARFNGLRQEYVLPLELSVPKAIPHIVKDGELLSDIAKLFYSNEAMLDFLAKANGIPKPYQIVKDQVILVPEIIEGVGTSVGGEEVHLLKSDSYAVAKGDTVKSIAEKAYGVEGAGLAGEMLLIGHNSLKKEFVISPEQALKIPALLEKYQPQETDTWEKISTKYYSDESGARMLETLNERPAVGQEIFIPKILKPEFSCASWIQAKEKNFSLKPKESKEVLFQVNLPRGGNLGGTYSAIITLEQLNKDNSGGGIRTSMNTVYNSVLILNLESRRPLLKTAEFHSFEIKKKDGLTGLVFGLKNLGKSQIQIRWSELRVLREDRSTVLKPMPLGAGPRVVLPGGRIELVSAIPKLPAGKYIAQARANYEGRIPAFMETTFEIGESKEELAKTRKVSIDVETKDKEEDINFSVDSKRKNLRAMTQVQIKNWETRPVKVTAKTVSMEGLSETFSAASTLEVRPIEFELLPFKSKMLNVILRDDTPQNGGRYGQLEITAELVNKADGEGGAVKIESAKRIVDVYVLGTGSDYKQSYTMEVFIDKVECINKQLVSLVRLKNTSNIHFKPQGKFEVIDGLGQIVFSGVMSMAEYLYPSQEQMFTPQADLSQKKIEAGKVYKVRLLFEGLTQIAECSMEFTPTEQTAEEEIKK